MSEIDLSESAPKSWHYAHVVKWWENSIRTWSGPAFALLIMQIVVSAGMVGLNAVGLFVWEIDPIRIVFVVSFGVTLAAWTATLIGILRRRAGAVRSEEGDA